MSPLTLLSPFTLEMWSCVVAAAALTTLIMFVVSRISPYQRRADGSAGIADTAWFVVAGMLGRNIGMVPKVGSTH